MSIRKPAAAHLVFLVFGLLVLAFGFYMRATEWGAGIGIPAFGALLVAVGLAWLPRPASAGIAAAAVVIAFFKVKGARDADAARWKAEGVMHQMTAVCDGTPMPALGAPNAKLRELHGYHGPGGKDPVTWLESGQWPVDLVPEFILCVDDTQEAGESGTFKDSAGNTQTMITFRHLADVTLRKTATAEAVFTKHYRGSEPPPLPTYIGPATHLDGSMITFEVIQPDLAPYLGADPQVAQRP